ncbi:uncharacterized protein LOC127749221 [Frankliniella occidentalis]|uniref:Regulatory protein zeste n=1 Tax=Frankliniella occidentalis TaxID=133901 RepID=A0A9C6U6V9_FRAOC|nr:uncharacterized protein LOC127749221 [Frankliniella occidentalis]
MQICKYIRKVAPLTLVSVPDPTEKQWMRLMDVVATDKEMQGDFQGPGAAGRVSAKWETLAATLNALGGAFKTGEKWKEAFNNLRNRAKRQYNDRVRYMGATGGGPPPPQQLGLNAVYQRVLQFVQKEQLHGNAVPVPLQGFVSVGSTDSYGD